LSAGLDARLAPAAHLNHVAALVWHSERGGGSAERIDGAVAIVAAHPFAFLNGVIAAGEIDDPAAVLDRAAELFTDHDRMDWSMFTRSTGEDEGLEQAARDRGLTVVNPAYPEMACLEPLDSPPADPDIEIRQIHGAAEVAAYWRLCGEAYETLHFPPDLFAAYTAGVLDPPASGCLAWLGDRPVGGAMAIVLEGVGFVGWVAAAPEARGRGVGAAVTAWATNRSFEDGAEFASLQASPMGLSIYERLGYRRLFDYRVWRYASDAGQISR
jgi:GNAT superfamily N-acetyltransferase